MRAISPDVGGEEVTFAEEQLDYAPVVAVRIGSQLGPAWLLRYTLTPAERQRIGAGEDLTLTFLGGVAPHELALFRDKFPVTPA